MTRRTIEPMRPRRWEATRAEVRSGRRKQERRDNNAGNTKRR